MIYTGPVMIDYNVYKFEQIEDEPLMCVMHIPLNVDSKQNRRYELYRDINCDGPTERWCLVMHYDSVRNGVTIPAKLEHDVYNGREITTESFMAELLENVLAGFGLISDNKND